MKHEPALSLKDLAVAIGVSPTYVSAMKKMGFQFTHAMRCQVSAAMAWLAEHPEFRQEQAYPKKRPNSPHARLAENPDFRLAQAYARKQSPPPPSKVRPPRVSPVDRSDEPGEQSGVQQAYREQAKTAPLQNHIDRQRSSNKSPGNRNVRLGALETEAQRIAKLGQLTVSDVVRICLAGVLPTVESRFMHRQMPAAQLH